MPRLSETRQRQTRRAIADAAIVLFTERGYADVTMEEVADAAGVSRRTAYRHFPNKYDLVFDHTERWLERFEAVVATRQPDETTRSIIRRGVLAVADEIDATAADVLAAWNVFVGHETLRGRNARAQEMWLLAHAGLLQADLPKPSDALEVMTVAGSLVAMTNALCFTWAAGQPASNMVELTEQALDILDPLWPAASR